MSSKRKITLLALLIVSIVSMIWFFVSDKQLGPPEETIQAEACDSCSARHQNLTKLRDARSLTASPDE